MASVAGIALLRETTVLVTGATGELGSTLIERLRHRAEVRALTRGRRPQDDDGFVWTSGDLGDLASLRAACEGVDCVIHLAAETHTRRAREYFSTNVEGTKRLLLAAQEAGVRRFVYVSTRAIGAAGGAYSCSKELAEQAVRDARIPWVILRPAEVYGSGRRDPVRTLAVKLQGRPYVLIPGDGLFRLSPVHEADVVAAVLEAMKQPEAVGRTYTLAGPEELTYLELVARLESALGLTARPRIHVPIPVIRAVVALTSRLGLGGLVPDQVPRLLLEKSSDNSAAIRDFEYSPRKLEEGLGSSS